MSLPGKCYLSGIRRPPQEPPMPYEKLIQFLGRYLPVVGRGLALGFGVLAVATAVFGMGDYPTASDRWLVAAVYALIAVASLVIVAAVRPMLRWMSR
jgi:hypothetical protein